MHINYLRFFVNITFDKCHFNVKIINTWIMFNHRNWTKLIKFLKVKVDETEIIFTHSDAI